ncbi:DUF1000-domain-containing protein [Serendipita vermifera]|nr:DUF1000-domain-containing protein [Serendipita vermifera]
MPDQHSHSCHDEHHDGHTHSHDAPLDDIPRETLFSIIDHQNVVALNVIEQKDIIKPWDRRNDDEIFLESDADDQMIIRIPFLDSSAKLTSILVKAGDGEQTPSKINLFVNEDNLDFDDVADRVPIQELEIPQSNEVGEYQLRPSKFSNVRSLTLFIPSAQGADTTKLYYLGFTGSFTKISNQPIITVYEASPNLADHKVTGIHESLAKQQF